MMSAHDKLSDIATSVDLLGYEKFARSVADRVRLAARHSFPLTIGIHGTWGSGKTSFLLMVADNLQRDGIHPIWFNAWKYDQEDNPRQALLQTILDQSRITGGIARRIIVRVRLWWSSISFGAGIAEIVRKTSTLALRFCIVIASLATLFLLSQDEIIQLVQQSSLIRGTSEFLPDPSLVDLMVKAIAITIGLLAAKPGDLLKIFDQRAQVDLSKFRRKNNLSRAGRVSLQL